MPFLTVLPSDLHFHAFSDDTYIDHYEYHNFAILMVVIMAKTEKWPKLAIWV